MSKWKFIKGTGLIVAFSVLIGVGTSKVPFLTSSVLAKDPTKPLLRNPRLRDAQQPIATERDGRVYFAERQVSFIPPPGFRALTPIEIALKYPRGNPPQYVYADDNLSVSIAIKFSEDRVTPEDLPKLKEFLESYLPLSLPGLRWIARDFVTINNVQWVKLEATSPAIDTNIHNDIYFTSYENKLLGFNFNSTVEMYDSVRAELLKSRDSILLGQTEVR